MSELPVSITNETELDELLTQPRPVLTEFIRGVRSSLVILGAGGKMGPTLAVLAKRAAEAAGHPLEIVAVSRFEDPAKRRWLVDRGVRTISADLLDSHAVRQLPDAEDVLYLVGLKFGTSQNPEMTWAVNTLAPAHAMERYRRSRVVALSTGNVYPLVPSSSGGSRETDALTPLGEYANSAVARERVFSYFSRKDQTPVALIRLNYAVEMRYGVLADIALKVFHGQPVDLSVPCLNCIWQADANEMILRALPLASSPAQAWNLTSPRSWRVRDLADRFGELFRKRPIFSGEEGASALLSDSSKIGTALGEPPTPIEDVLRWTAHWISSGGRLLNKPTHFEVRDGKY